MIQKYLTRAQIGKLTGWRRERVRQFIRGLQASGRYPPNQVIQDGRVILIHEAVVLDWLQNEPKKKEREKL